MALRTPSRSLASTLVRPDAVISQLDFLISMYGALGAGPVDSTKPQNESFKANWAILGETAVFVIIPKLAPSTA